MRSIVMKITYDEEAASKSGIIFDDEYDICDYLNYARSHANSTPPEILMDDAHFVKDIAAVYTSIDKIDEIANEKK